MKTAKTKNQELTKRQMLRVHGGSGDDVIDRDKKKQSRSGKKL